MESLSAELVELIFRRLDVLSLVHSTIVCNQWINYTTNWRLWQSFYFQRWPFHKDDVTYKKSVGAQWKSLYIRMHTYSRDVLCLHEVDLRNNVQRYMEEVLISPYVLNKNCLYCGAESGFFWTIAQRFCITEYKNELLSTFSYDLSFIHRQNKFSEEFLKVLTAAKAKGKKTLLIVPNFEGTPSGVNPIIARPDLSQEFLTIVNTYRDDIILMIYSATPHVITEPFLQLFASCKMNMVHINLPDAEDRRVLLPEQTKKKIVDHSSGDSQYFDLDLNVLVEKLNGADSDTIIEVRNRMMKGAYIRACQSQQEDERIHTIVTMDDFMRALNVVKVTMDSCPVLDRKILEMLQSIVNSYPDDLKLVSI